VCLSEDTGCRRPPTEQQYREAACLFQDEIAVTHFYRNLILPSLTLAVTVQSEDQHYQSVSNAGAALVEMPQEGRYNFPEMLLTRFIDQFGTSARTSEPVFP
jgi:hypothetical protein